MKDITIHMVVRDEPFIYYALKSVYANADVILLYDTGSTDKNMLEDLSKIMDEDVDKKIVFKNVKIDVDQTDWDSTNVTEREASWKGKFGVGCVRQMQIDDTQTEHFMLVDGDEVHYNGAVERIKRRLLPKITGDFVWATLFYYRYYDINTILGFKKRMGRVFRTSEVYMEGTYPQEMHAVKKIGGVDKEYRFHVQHSKVKPFAHFEPYVKPWRRKSLVDRYPPSPPQTELPEVMVENLYYVNRFENGG